MNKQLLKDKKKAVEINNNWLKGHQLNALRIAFDLCYAGEKHDEGLEKLKGLVTWLESYKKFWDTEEYCGTWDLLSMFTESEKESDMLLVKMVKLLQN